MVVDVQLIRGRDHPQRIFESMNATGLTLTDCDLIRNFLLMDLEPAAQDTLYARYLHPIETDFGRDAYERHFPSLVRAYLALRTGERPKPSALYGAFKDYASSRPVRAAPPDALAADLRRHARYFCAIALGQEPDPVLHRAFARAKQVNLQSALPAAPEALRGMRRRAPDQDRLRDHRQPAGSLPGPPRHLRPPRGRPRPRLYAPRARAGRRRRARRAPRDTDPPVVRDRPASRATRNSWQR